MTDKAQRCDGEVGSGVSRLLTCWLMPSPPVAGLATEEHPIASDTKPRLPRWSAC